MMAATASATIIKIHSGPLTNTILNRVVKMLTTRTQYPIDHLDDTLLITDAVAAHTPAHNHNQHILMIVETQKSELKLRVQKLRPDNTQTMINDAKLPNVNNVFEQIADKVHPNTNDDNDKLMLHLHFAT